MHKVALAFALCTVAISAAAESTIEKLAWMTGTWSGPLGEGTLEENWTVPRDGSIQSKDGLVLHLEQWNPGYESRGPATKMRSTTIGENEVSFEVVGEGAFKTLAYKRPADNEFEIHIDGGAMVIKLTAAGD